MSIDLETGQTSRSTLSGVRKMIASRMSRSHAEIPAVHIVDEIDVTDLPLSRLLATVVVAVSRTVLSHKELNAHFDGRELTTFENCNVGIAVDTDNGLLVPVLRRADQKSVDDISAEIEDLAARARTNSLSTVEMQGATITVTSPGKRSGLWATPLINPPQTAIIGIYRATERPVVIDRGVVVRAVANLSVTFDHRVIDGAEGGDFTTELVSAVEHMAVGSNESRES